MAPQARPSRAPKRLSAERLVAWASERLAAWAEAWLSQRSKAPALVRAKRSLRPERPCSGAAWGRRRHNASTELVCAGFLRTLAIAASQLDIIPTDTMTRSIIFAHTRLIARKTAACAGRQGGGGTKRPPVVEAGPISMLTMAVIPMTMKKWS